MRPSPRSIPGLLPLLLSRDYSSSALAAALFSKFSEK